MTGGKGAVQQCLLSVGRGMSMLILPSSSLSSHSPPPSLPSFLINCIEKIPPCIPGAKDQMK